MKKSLQRGFTLIELLVVIAIIGILASIILASLNSARSKGSDAAIKGNMNGIRDQAEIVYDNASPNAYTTVCGDATVVAALGSAKTASGAASYTTAIATPSSATVGACHANATAYAVEFPLKSDSAQNWCVDSTGKSTQTATVLGANIVTCS